MSVICVFIVCLFQKVTTVESLMIFLSPFLGYVGHWFVWVKLILGHGSPHVGGNLEQERLVRVFWPQVSCLCATWYQKYN